MTRRMVLALVLIALAVAALVAGAVVQRELRQSNSFIMLFPLELLALPVAGAALARWLHAHRDHATNVLAVGLYLLIVAGALSTLYPLWLPSDNTILGSALLAGIWAGVGAYLALTSAAVLSERPLWKIRWTGAMLAMLLVTAGGMVSPLMRLQVPILTVAVVGVAALLLTRNGRPLVQPVVLALIGGAATNALLVLRGPGDWASNSTSVKLYSFPILVMAFGVSLALLDLARTRPGDTLDQ